MEQIIKQIYSSCDPNNINQVPASTLLDFVKPYLRENLDELLELQNKLDPTGTDPCVSGSFFEHIMSDWVARIKDEELNNSLSGLSNNSAGASGDTSLNMSGKIPSNNNTIAVEEQVQQLQYQLQKTVNELELVKQQLALAEEQNEALSFDLQQFEKQRLRDQQLNDEFNKSQLENEEIKEEADAKNRKIQQLTKTVASLEKENEALTFQNGQLENENAVLKERMTRCEKVGVERRKSLTSFKDELDLKEAEISSLTEIIEELQSKLEEKTDLVKFYTNENKLLKQKGMAFENLFRDVFPDGNLQAFNTPKLMRQLAHPVSPGLGTPSRGCSTSSPISPAKHAGGVDLFTAGIVTVLRSPHLTLRDEMSQVCNESGDDSDEVSRLQKVVKEQKVLEKSLWEYMKDLSNDNEALGRYKRRFEELLHSNREKDDTIRRLREELEASVTNHSSQTEIELKTERSVSDKATETDWDVPVAPSRSTNHAKLHMKLERLLEKLEAVEKELANERRINTTLTLKLQQLREENRKICDEASFYCEKAAKKKEILASLLGEKRALAGELEVLKMENEGLRKENVVLKEEKRCLASEKFNLGQNLQNALSRLAGEAAVANSVRAENELLANVQRQCEFRLNEERIREIHLKKQVMDLTTNRNLIIIDLQKQLAEKSAQIEQLKKEIEVGEIVEAFLSANNRELERIIEPVLGRFKEKFGDELDHDLIRELDNPGKILNSNLENDMLILKNNIKVVTHLLQIFADRYDESSGKDPEIQSNPENLSSNSSSVEEFDSLSGCRANSTPNEDSFISCYSEISVSVQEYMNVLDIDSDSFLDNLEIHEQDLRELSKKELEDKFTALALTLTVDFSSASKRHLVQKEKCNRLLMKFFTYLNYSTDLIRRCEQNSFQKSAITYLNLLKNLSEDVFKAAVHCGLLQYENRTINCWNLVINYVAALSQENKQIKFEDKSNQVTIDRVVQTNESTVPPLLPRLSVYKRVKCFFSVFFVVLFVLILLVVYFDSLCPKKKFGVCPVEWILNSFAKRIHCYHSLP